MANSYFNWLASVNRFVRFDTVRSADLNAALDLVDAGFTLVGQQIAPAFQSFSQAAAYPAATFGKRLQQTISVKDAPYNAVGDGVTDDTVAIQAAITAAAGKLLFFPAGTYIVTAQLNLPDAPLKIIGAGHGVSILVWTFAVTAGMSVTYTDIQTQLSIDDVTLKAGVAGCGIAVKATWPATASWTKRTFTSRNIEITPSTLATHYWNEGLVLDYAWNAVIDHPMIRGKDNTVSMTSCINLKNRSNDVSITNPQLYFAADGVLTGDLCEGTTILGIRAVYVNYGVNSNATTDSPFLLVAGGHIAALLGGVRAIKKSQSHVISCTIYKRAEATGAFNFVYLDTCPDARATNNTFEVLAGATGTAVGVLSANCNAPQVNFNTSNGADTTVQFDASCTNYTAVGNRRIGGTNTIVAAGTGTNIMRDNLPKDAANSGLQLFAVNSATPSVQNAYDTAFATANSGATVITNILDGFLGQVVNILVNDANTTVQHNANISLQGSVNFVPGNGSILTLKKDAIWREVSRRTA